MLERFYSLVTKFPLDVITHFFILVPILIGIVKYSYLKRDMRLVLLFFFVDFCAETVALFSMLKGGTTLYIPDIRASFDIVLVSGIYNAALVRDNQKKTILVIGAIFFIFSIMLYNGDSVAPWSQTAFRVYAIGATLAYYNAILSDLNLKKIQHHSMFWFTAGLLFYAGGTLFSMLFIQYLYALNTPNDIFDRYWVLINTLYIFFCLLASVGFWVSKYDKNNYFERDYFKGEFFKK